MKIKNLIKNILHLFLAGKKGYADLKVLKGPAKGSKLRLDLRKEGSYWLGTYDKWLFDTIPFTDYIKPGFVIWDCGSYVGYYTAVCRNIIGKQGKIYAFEASTENYERLKYMPQINKWENVEIVNWAIGPDHTTLKFISNIGGSCGPYGLSKSYDEDIKLNIEEVRSCGIDELVYELGFLAPDFIKFDLESGEEFALHNGDKVFSEKRPVILLELHGQKAKDASGLFLEKYNYSGSTLDNLYDATKKIYSKSDFDKILNVPYQILCIPE